MQHLSCPRETGGEFCLTGDAPIAPESAPAPETRTGSLSQRNPWPGAAEPCLPPSQEIPAADTAGGFQLCWLHLLGQDRPNLSAGVEDAETLECSCQRGLLCSVCSSGSAREGSTVCAKHPLPLCPESWQMFCRSSFLPAEASPGADEQCQVRASSRKGSYTLSWTVVSPLGQAAAHRALLPVWCPLAPKAALGASISPLQGEEGGHGVTESHGLEKTSEIIKCSFRLSASTPAEPCHEIPSLLGF